MKKWYKAFAVFLAGSVLCACASYKTVTGNMQETVKTMFYNFTVNSCYSTTAIQEYTPAAGNLFIVVNVTVENTYQSDLSLTDSHFQMQTLSDEGSSDDNDSSTAAADISAAYPLTSSTDVLYLTDELPKEYELKKGEKRTGTLIFEMPADQTIFNFCTADYFNYGTSGKPVTGNTYFVQVTPEAQ